MKLERREFEVELIPESDFERVAVAELLKHRTIEIRPGKTTDRNWPPSDRQTNVCLVLPDPNKW